MMKYVLWLLLILSSFTFNLDPLHAERSDPSKTLIRYFKALKHGDIETMKECIGGDYYADIRVLMERNKAYPNFLKKFYQGAKLQIMDSYNMGASTVAVVKVHFPDGSTNVNKLRLVPNNGDWRIVEEID